MRKHRLCVECQERLARYVSKGRPRSSGKHRSDAKGHNLCFQCFRGMVNSLRIRPRFEQRNIAVNDRIYHALFIAEKAHRGQTRKYLDEPYIVHSARVARALGMYGFDSHVQAAGFLHDVVEDTSVTMDDLEGDPQFSAKTLNLVKRVTKWWPDQADATYKAEQKPLYYAGILEDLDATVLKVVDRTDNLHDFTKLLASPTLTVSQWKWARNYATKTLTEFEPLIQRLSIWTVITEPYKAAISELYTKIHSTDAVA